MFFYIVATPIGNLEDITLRALRTLKEVDFILCEDTRVTKTLLNHYGITVKTISYHEHSDLAKTQEIIDLLKSGKNLALVTDAGTPGISDPGSKLIQEIITSFGSEVNIVPIPGPSAIITAVSVSGLPLSRFFFAGFPPTKSKRKKFFEEISYVNYPVVFYESPYRIIKTLKELEVLVPTRKLVVCQELTKKFEKIHRGTVSEILQKLAAAGPKELKGEFVAILQEE